MIFGKSIITKSDWLNISNIVKCFVVSECKNSNTISNLLFHSHDTICDMKVALKFCAGSQWCLYWSNLKLNYCMFLALSQNFIWEWMLIDSNQETINARITFVKCKKFVIAATTTTTPAYTTTTTTARELFNQLLFTELLLHLMSSCCWKYNE
jgi:hypothetical protein